MKTSFPTHLTPLSFLKQLCSLLRQVHSVHCVINCPDCVGWVHLEHLRPCLRFTFDFVFLLHAGAKKGFPTELQKCSWSLSSGFTQMKGNHFVTPATTASAALYNDLHELCGWITVISCFTCAPFAWKADFGSVGCITTNLLFHDSSHGCAERTCSGKVIVNRLCWIKSFHFNHLEISWVLVSAAWILFWLLQPLQGQILGFYFSKTHESEEKILLSIPRQ